MVELADTQDLGSCGAARAGSSPAGRIPGRASPSDGKKEKNTADDRAGGTESPGPVIFLCKYHLIRGNFMDNYYFKHYFNLEKAGRFLLVSLAGFLILLLVLILISRIKGNSENGADPEDQLPDGHSTRANVSGRSRRRGSLRDTRRNRSRIVLESFYEMVFSSTSILFFLALYYLIGTRIQATQELWEHYKDAILIVLTLLSIILNHLLDHLLVHLTQVPSSQKASVRLLSTLYIVLIFVYIRFIYEDTNYDGMIIYFLTLVLGRFFYFDFTWADFTSALRGLWHNLPLLFLMCAYSGLVCWYGFHTQFLLKSNGVIVSTLIAHLFMDAAICILDRIDLPSKMF
jgi:hypothetical protein